MHPDLPQDISNIWRSANFIESVPSLCINSIEQELTEDSTLSLDFEADMSHPVPLEDLYPPTSTDRLQLNSPFMVSSQIIAIMRNLFSALYLYFFLLRQLLLW